jgi:hypothetical protein
VTVLVAIRKTLMISAAVVSSFLVLRILPARLPSVSVGSPRTSGITATEVFSTLDAPEGMKEPS